MMKSGAPIACAMVFLGVIAGCGPGRGDLAGRVSFEGHTVCSGSVLVRGNDGIVKTSPIAADGAYQVKDVAAGPIQVFVSSPDPAPPPMGAPNPRRKGSPPKTMDRSKWFPIPEEYCKFDAPKLTFDLTPGPNTFDIVLK